MAWGAVAIHERATSLRADSSAEEFLRAGPSVRGAFVARMCADDGCLAPEDRRCGWATPDAGTSGMILGRCLEMAAGAVLPDTRLVTLSRYCGTVFAERLDSPGAAPEACAEAGGIWGKRADPVLPGRD